MKNKMNATEFKEALTLAGLDFDILGFEGVLNALSMFYDYKAEEYSNSGFEAIANDKKKIANKLYGTLCTRGYYSH